MIFRFDVQLATDLFAGTLNSDLITGFFGTGRLKMTGPDRVRGSWNSFTPGKGY